MVFEVRQSLRLLVRLKPYYQHQHGLQNKIKCILWNVVSRFLLHHIWIWNPNKEKKPSSQGRETSPPPKKKKKKKKLEELFHQRNDGLLITLGRRQHGGKLTTLIWLPLMPLNFRFGHFIQLGGLQLPSSFCCGWASLLIGSCWIWLSLFCVPVYIW